MADSFGALQLPSIDTEAPIGDPSLGYLASFCRDVINAELATAWQKLLPRSDGKVVNVAFTHDPAKCDFRENALPALFLYREKTSRERVADEYVINRSRVAALWVPPPEAHQHFQSDREPFGNAICAAIELACEFGRHPAWQEPSDKDPDALSIAADAGAWLQPTATRVTPTTYETADFDGSLGVAQRESSFEAFEPRREPTITTSVAVGAFNTADDIIVTGISWYGVERTYPVRLSSEDGGETIRLGEDIKELVSVRLPGMLTTNGLISIGAEAIHGKGSFISNLMGLLIDLPTVIDWVPARVEIGIYDSEGVQRQLIRYEAVKVTIELQEQLVCDLSRVADSLESDGSGVDIAVVKDGRTVTAASLPDNGSA